MLFLPQSHQQRMLHQQLNFYQSFHLMMSLVNSNWTPAKKFMKWLEANCPFLNWLTPQYLMLQALKKPLP
jgi:hypothetical protein